MSQEQREWRILQALADCTALHIIDLAKQIEEHPVAVDRACARLHNEDYISLSGYGIYDVTTRGQRRLEELEDAYGQMDRREK